MIDADDIRCRFLRLKPFLDERGRRLFAANEALSLGRGGASAVSSATGIARSTINRGIAELQSSNGIAASGAPAPGAAGPKPASPD